MNETRTKTPGAITRPALHRHWLAIWWHAHRAVKARISVAVYLRHQVAQHMLRLTSLGMRLPLEVSLDGDELRLREVAAPEPEAQRLVPSAEEVEREQESELARRHGPAALAELTGERARGERLDEQVAEARAELDRRRGELAAALASGQAASLGKRPASMYMRPAVPSPFPGVVAMTGAVLLVLAEAWQLAVPILNANGLDAGDLRSEFLRAPPQVLLAVAMALGCTAGLVYLAHVALQHGSRSLHGGVKGRRRLADAVIAAAASALALFAAWQLGGLRHESAAAGLALVLGGSGSVSGSLPFSVFFLMTGLLPFFSAVLFDAGQASLGRRAGYAKDAWNFDRSLRAREEIRERLEERIRLAEQALLDQRVQRTGSEVAVRRLGWLGEEAKREAASEKWLAGEALARAREELRAAIEADRLAYLKAAGRAGGLAPGGPARPIVLFSPEGAAAPRGLSRRAA
jgi:hypothetical protein